jgi:hypothetical protein
VGNPAVGAPSGTSPEEESGLRVNQATGILEELQRRNPVTANVFSPRSINPQDLKLLSRSVATTRTAHRSVPERTDSETGSHPASERPPFATHPVATLENRVSESNGDFTPTELRH